MSSQAKIGYEIVIEGADKTINQLKEIQRLKNSIESTGGVSSLSNIQGANAAGGRRGGATALSSIVAAAAGVGYAYVSGIRKSTSSIEYQQGTGGLRMSPSPDISSRARGLLEINRQLYTQGGGVQDFIRHAQSVAKEKYKAMFDEAVTAFDPATKGIKGKKLKDLKGFNKLSGSDISVPLSDMTYLQGGEQLSKREKEIEESIANANLSSAFKPVNFHIKKGKTNLSWIEFNESIKGLSEEEKNKRRKEYAKSGAKISSTHEDILKKQHLGGTAYGLEGPQGLGSGIPMPNVFNVLPQKIVEGFSKFFRGVSGMGYDIGSSLGQSKYIRGLTGGHAMQHIMRGAGVPREYRPLIGEFAKLGPLVVGVVVAFLALRKAIELVIEGIRTGSDLYKTAAGTGGSIGTTFARQQAFGDIGVHAGQQELQFGYSNSAQFLNMAKEFEEALHDARIDAMAMRDSAKATMRESMDISAVAREWKTLWTEVAAIMYPILHILAQVLKNILQGEVQYLDLILKLEKKLGLPQQDEFKNKGFGGENIGRTNSLERMGFVMKNAAPDNTNLKAINRTTQKISEILLEIFNVINHNTPGGMLSPSVSLPQYP